MHGIGELIKVNRIKLGHTQAELCVGICSEVSLSRIENGKQVPSRGTFEALMEALGLTPGVYPSFLNDEDKFAYELKYDFDKFYTEENYEEAERTLLKLEKLPKLEEIYKQFIAHGRVMIKQQQGMPPDQAVAAFEKVITTFIKSFTIEKIKTSLLSKTQINILNAYAVARRQAGDTAYAIAILRELVDYIDNKVYDHESTTVIYTKILYNLSKYVGMSGDYKEAIVLCEHGIKQCLRYHRFTYYPHLLYNYGFGLVKIGQTEKAKESIRACYVLTRVAQGTTVLSLTGIEKFANENGIDL